MKFSFVEFVQSELEMAGESSAPVQAVLPAELNLSKTEEELRKAVRSNSHAILARAVETPISEMDIPLCRMIVMTDVWQPLEIDIQKLRSEFTMGYMTMDAFINFMYQVW